MSFLISIGDFFHRLGGKNKNVFPNWDTLSEPIEGEIVAIQCVGLNGTPDQYRSFTEIGRQVAGALNFQINTYTGEVFDAKGKNVADTLEVLSYAMADLGWISNNTATASPYVDWGKVGINNPEAAVEELKAQISSYEGTYWQHLTSKHII